MEEHEQVYLIKNQIKKNILKHYKVIISRYHGGDLEGNSIRILMKNGNIIFANIVTYLCEQNYEKLIGNSNDIISNA